MYYLYVLQSMKDLGYYIGISDNITKRIKEHNLGKTKSIKNRTPFILKYSEEYSNKTDARRREIELKKSCRRRKELLNSIGFNLK